MSETLIVLIKKLSKELMGVNVGNILLNWMEGVFVEKILWSGDTYQLFRKAQFLGL